MTPRFRALDELIMYGSTMIIRIVEVKAHSYVIESVNYPSTYPTWEVDWESAERCWRKLTKLEKALK